MNILGVSAFYHDSAAALVADGEIVAAAQEERFTRKKHDAAFPKNAIRYCLEQGSLGGAELDAVVFYDKPFLKFERLIETCLAFAPSGFASFRQALPVWMSEKLFQKSLLVRALREFDSSADWAAKLRFTEHHLSHAASAFFPSRFDEAIILTMDGVGEWATTSVAHGKGNSLNILKEIHFPHSLGLLYSAFTYYAGFKVNSGEYKLMGLAPFGEAKYKDKIFAQLIDAKADGSFRLNLRYFDYCTGQTMTNRRFHDLFGRPPRRPSEPIAQFHMDLAASIQAVLEETILRITRSLAAETGIPNLCLAGGVALNCVANGKVLRDGHFKNIWIQPAAGDAGGALGAALAVYHQFFGRPRKADGASDRMRGSYLGPEFPQAEIERRLNGAGARFTTMSEKELIAACACSLAQKEALGWFQGRMEFGPRALGARSILADPRSATMQSVLNTKVKRRESFRPFAPAVLRERAHEFFELDVDSPYMLLVAEVVKSRRHDLTAEERNRTGLAMLDVPRSDIPAVTHVDYSARVQTVHKETNPRFHALLSAFDGLTGCPVVVNTSFNIRGEPMVCTPEDAFRCFMSTEIDTLAIGDCFLRKKDQDAGIERNLETAFDLD